MFESLSTAIISMVVALVALLLQTTLSKLSGRLKDVFVVRFEGGEAAKRFVLPMSVGTANIANMVKAELELENIVKQAATSIAGQTGLNVSPGEFFDFIVSNDRRAVAIEAKHDLRTLDWKRVSKYLSGEPSKPTHFLIITNDDEDHRQATSKQMESLASQLHADHVALIFAHGDEGVEKMRLQLRKKLEEAFA